MHCNLNRPYLIINALDEECLVLSIIASFSLIFIKKKM